MNTQTVFDNNLIKKGVSLLLVTGGVIFAIIRRFVQDDAYISFRYARNLANGLGLVWNAGEYVEGYTNFLWTLLLTPSFLLHVDVVIWSWALSIACFAAVLWLLCQWPGADAYVRFAAAGLVVSNFSLTSYATGGLETQLVTVGVVSSAWFLALRRPIPAAIAAAAAVMARMDAVLLLAPFWLAAVFLPGTCGGRTRRGRTFLAGLLLVGGPVCAWLLWRHAYYGAWVPNTFLVKGGASPLRGLIYVTLFFLVYGWFLPPVVAIVTRHGRTDLRGVILRSPTLLVAVALHLAYVILIGGDFMEFRMIAPCAPFAALLLAEWLRGRPWLLVALLALGPVGAPLLLPPRPVESVPGLSKMVADWSRDAELLNAILGEDGRDVRIALTPAGVIPFSTGLYAFDELGLNSRDVALNGERIKPLHRMLGNLPGHSVKATWEQIRAAMVNLVIDHPWLVDVPVEEILPLDSQGRVRREAFNVAHPFLHVEVPAQSGAHLVVWPIGDSASGAGKWWIMILAEPCEAVSRAIKRTRAQVLDFDS